MGRQKSDLLFQCKQSFRKVRVVIFEAPESRIELSKSDKLKRNGFVDHQYTRALGAIFFRLMPPSASVVSGSRWTGR